MNKKGHVVILDMTWNFLFSSHKGYWSNYKIN